MLAAWEVKPSFAMKWWWLLDQEIIKASNFWRGERGEEPLVIPAGPMGMIEEVV